MQRNQPESFCHMLYRAEDGTEVSIWNSRNAVTPFMVHIDGVTFQHVEWNKDRPESDYEPKVGDYVFEDLTLDTALAHRTKYVERYWDRGEYPVREHFEGKTQEQAVLRSLRQLVASGAEEVP